MEVEVEVGKTTKKALKKRSCSQIGDLVGAISTVYISSPNSDFLPIFGPSKVLGFKVANVSFLVNILELRGLSVLELFEIASSILCQKILYI